MTVTLDADPKQTVTIPITRTGQDGHRSDDYAGLVIDTTALQPWTTPTVPPYGHPSSWPPSPPATSPSQSPPDDTGAATVSPASRTFNTSETWIATWTRPSPSPASTTPTPKMRPYGHRHILGQDWRTQPTGNVTELSHLQRHRKDLHLRRRFPRPAVPSTLPTGTWTRPSPSPASTHTDAQDERLTVSLTASGADYARVTGSVTVNVTDDDPPTSLTVNFGRHLLPKAGDPPTTANVTENSGHRDGDACDDPKQTVMIPGQARTGHPATTTPANVFNLATPKTFTFMATPDTLDDDGESVTLTLHAPHRSGGRYPGSTNETVISIARRRRRTGDRHHRADRTAIDGSAIFSVTKLATQPTGRHRPATPAPDGFPGQPYLQHFQLEHGPDLHRLRRRRHRRPR